MLTRSPTRRSHSTSLLFRSRTSRLGCGLPRRERTAYLSGISRLLPYLALIAGFSGAPAAAFPEESDSAYEVQLRAQRETTPGSGRFHRELRQESWKAAETAVIVCDMWDSHHCVNAVRRGTELGPRVDALLRQVRQAGATVIHAPSDCMGAYTEHPARKRALALPRAASTPDDIATWCDRIPAEEAAAYPLDQSAGGEDDELHEHAAWAARLAADGRNPRAPWLKQMDSISIDPERDWISDSGPEIWSILDSRRIQHVILVGVHTNMCVLGRPFGLRQLSSHGRQVVLARDLTDTMYDPSQWPYVNHFTGTDLIVDHIERYVCPTITSDALLGGSAFRFRDDKRQEIAFVIAEDEYRTEQTLPQLAAAHLGRTFRTQFVFSSDTHRHELPGLEQIASADALVVSVRRRPLPPADLERIRQFVATGKPVIGVRTASHAFSLRNQAPPADLADWPEFDSQVFGGNYTNHHGNDQLPQIAVPQPATPSALASGMPAASFVSRGSLYKVSPLAAGTQILLEGSIPGHPSEPVAWTMIRSDGGRSFYTSLGHWEDFENDAFRTLLVNGIHWACDQPQVDQATIAAQRAAYAEGRGKQR
jgi:type 1 glutamine amidotransferase/nicotinamidase-related amidase